MCRFAYLAVAFRGDPPKDAAALVTTHAERAGRPLTVVQPSEGTTLARFGERCAVVATFRCAQCACDWGVAEAEGMKGVAASLLRASDVQRVRLGVWDISGAVDVADHDGSLEPTAVGLEDADVSRFDTRSSWQLELARSGPPWPTQKLAQLDVQVAR